MCNKCDPQCCWARCKAASPFGLFLLGNRRRAGREDAQIEAVITTNTVKIPSSIGIATDSASVAASSTPYNLMMEVSMTPQTQLHPSIEPYFFTPIRSLAKRKGKEEEVPQKCTNAAISKSSFKPIKLGKKGRKRVFGLADFPPLNSLYNFDVLPADLDEHEVETLCKSLALALGE